jgi:hypothetical protein
VVSSNSVKCIAAVFLLLLLGAAMPAFSHQELVLIVSTRSEVDNLDPDAVRRLFVGLTVTRNRARLRPVLNESDPQIKALFLENIVSMSESTYDRYILRLALLQGRIEPMIYRSDADVINAVALDPTVVGYVWAKDAAQDSRVKILRIMWHD